jgi:beta-lysine 5,6-aminomutase beta subunit
MTSASAAVEVRPYGDKPDDGVVQLSFTLPVAAGARATEAARVLVQKMGFRRIEVVHTQDLGAGFTFFVVYGRELSAGVSDDEIVVVEPEIEMWDGAQINGAIERNFGRRLTVVGACIGTDIHAVGIDAILNLKGYKGHPGLEMYSSLAVFNLGSQVASEALVTEAIKRNADAILISQVVTQNDLHIKALTEFIELSEGFGVRDRMVMIAGGPGITNRLALELGFDGGFGRGTYGAHVATFIIKKLVERRRAESALSSADTFADLEPNR